MVDLPEPVHHIPGIKNQLSDYISRNNFDTLIGESSEALAREAFCNSFHLHGFRVYFLSRHRSDLLLLWYSGTQHSKGKIL